MENWIPIENERMYLFSINSNTSMTAKIQGTLTHEIVEQALEKLVRRHVLLTATIGIEKDQKAYYNLFSAKKIVPQYYPYAEVNRLEQYIQQEDMRLFPIGEGPLLRFFVFQGDQRSILLLVAHRLLGDGVSLKLLIEDFIYYANHPEEEVTGTMPLPFQKILQSKKDSRPDWFTSYAINSMNREWKKHPTQFGYHAYETLCSTYHRAHKMGLIIKELNEKSTKPLCNNCEEKKVSTENALITAFLAVLNNFDPIRRKKEIRVGNTIDLRSKANPEYEREIGCYSTEFYFRKKYLEKLSYWGNSIEMEKYKKQKLGEKHKRYFYMQKALCMHPALLDSMYFSVCGQCQEEVSKKAAEMLLVGQRDRGIKVTSLGMVNYNSQEEITIDSLCYIPAPSISNELSIGAVIVNGRLMLSVRYDKSKYSARIVEDMIRTAVNYMWNRG